MKCNNCPCTYESCSCKIENGTCAYEINLKDLFNKPALKIHREGYGIGDLIIPTKITIEDSNGKIIHPNDLITGIGSKPN